MEEAEVLTSGSEVVPRDFLQCPLCQDEYQEPKFLPCLHSFCKACIDDYMESGTSPDVCPVCLTDISPPSDAETDDTHTATMTSGGGSNSVPELPDNMFARRLSCPVITQDKKTEVQYCQQQQCCSNSGVVGLSWVVQKEASIHCINCDEFMCAQCSMEHLAEKETASHKTQSIEEYSRANGENSPSPTEITHIVPIPQCCQFYDALDIGTMYCVDCEMATCNECNAKDHADHRCAELSAIAH